jgi:hypothetical protein
MFTSEKEFAVEYMNQSSETPALQTGSVW